MEMLAFAAVFKSKFHPGSYFPILQILLLIILALQYELTEKTPQLF